jgi:hypothetical protein
MDEMKNTEADFTFLILMENLKVHWFKKGVNSEFLEEIKALNYWWYCWERKIITCHELFVKCREGEKIWFERGNLDNDFVGRKMKIFFEDISDENLSDLTFHDELNKRR